MEEDRYDNGTAPSWGMFLVGVAVTVAAFYVGFMRPASQQLSYLQRQINRMERSVRELTDAKDGAGKANDLLTQLVNQGQLVEAARASLDNIQRLHRQLDLEMARVQRVRVSVQELSELRNVALRQAEQTAKAHDALLSLENLQGRLLEASQLTDDARARTDALLQLENSLMDSSEDTAKAQEHLDSLIDLRERISSEGYDLELAQERLSSLLNLKDDILSYTSGLANAIEAMESTMELQGQFQKVAGSLDQIRGWFAEFLMLEPTIEHAMKSLQPLTELGNLSRLSAAELRDAAQAIVTNRHANLAQKPAREEAPPTVNAEATNWEAVPAHD